MTIDASHLGQRMVVRHVIAGQGASGGPALTDVVGRVLAVGETHVTLERRDGTPVDVALADVVAAKVVPPTPVRSRRAISISADNLTRITSLGWPAIESVPLGEWELRSSGGFTGRANSVAAVGDPGTDMVEAIAAVEDFYRSRDRPPIAQVVVGTDIERAFVDSGWRPFSDKPGGAGAIVQVAQLTSVHLTGIHSSGPDMIARADISAVASDEWMGIYHRVNDPEVARKVLEGPSTVGFVSIGSPMTAIGRVVVTGEWTGLSCVEVVAGHRRLGLATRIVEASIAWARLHGADKAYLQTMSDNTAALALYAPYGFTTHHEYVYLTPPST